MTVPGASGGTMAMMLGIYQILLEAVTDFFHAPLQNGKILLKTAAGGLLGLLCVSGWVKGWMLFYPTESTLFFEGCMAGGTILVLAEGFQGPKKGTAKRLLLLLPGVAAGAVAFFYPLTFSGEGFLYRMVMGVLLAVALILPGVSVSASLYMLGLYQDFFRALEEVDIGFLFPILLGGLIGGSAMAGLLKKWMEKYPRGCRCLIAGFLIASFASELPAWQTERVLSWKILWFIGGALLIESPKLYEKIKNRRKEKEYADTQSLAAG